MVLHAIASHLLSHPRGEIACIDTTGSFSPWRLREVLVFRLEAQSQRDSYQQSGFVYEKVKSNAHATRKELIGQATSMLDRVKVMRVFDFIGVLEAVEEIGVMREANAHRDDVAEETAVSRRREEVGDSEAETEDEEDRSCQPTVSGPMSAQTMNAETEVEAFKSQIGMIVVDTITNVVSSTVSKSQIQGQALLVSFMQSLHRLTSRNNICTILTNATVGVTSSNNPNYQRWPDENVSVFASTSGKPALGKTFTFVIDTSVFMSTVPRSLQDAENAFGERGEDSSFSKVFILEVIKDRCGTREGRWVAFDLVDGVKIVPCRV